MSRPTPAPLIAGILAAILLLFGAYMGSYYALLEGAVSYTSPSWPSSGAVNFQPVYRLQGGPWLETSLRPAHRIDRFVRPRYWGDSR